MPRPLLRSSVAALMATTLAIPGELRAGDMACPPGMVFVPGGAAPLGLADDVDALAPAARALGPLCVDRTEVTVAQYLACVAGGRCPASQGTIFFPGYGPPEPMRSQLSAHCNAPRPDRKDHPMNCVDQEAAALYCASQGGRLPSEEEWEYAARGPEANRYPWGSWRPGASSAPLCWDRRRSALGTCPVGQFPGGATRAGALDMAGNVWEWTASSRSGAFIVRGGGWTNFLPRFVSSTYRWPLAASTRLNCLGFRCVRPSE